MTAAKCQLPGTSWVSERALRWGVPHLDPGLQDEHLYMIADAAGPTGVVIHVGVVEPDRVGFFLTDTTGELSVFQRRHQTTCTRYYQKRGDFKDTIWNNRGPQERPVLDDWETALDEMARIAARAVRLGQCRDPYAYPGYIGPRHWGTHEWYPLPGLIADRTQRQAQAVFLPQPPRDHPDLPLDDLIDLADAEIAARIAKLVEYVAREPDDVECAYEPVGQDDAIPWHPALEAEHASWLVHYERCRDEFPDRPDVAFPAGTIRFRKLGAGCDRPPVWVGRAPPRTARHPRPVRTRGPRG